MHFASQHKSCARLQRQPGLKTYILLCFVLVMSNEKAGSVTITEFSLFFLNEWEKKIQMSGKLRESDRMRKTGDGGK